MDFFKKILTKISSIYFQLKIFTKKIIIINNTLNYSQNCDTIIHLHFDQNYHDK